jgi:NAD(P)-dependent dehydrogenase (short-subunit alcohol dehydrogenase family)
VNLIGVWLCMKYELEVMLPAGKGAIVNTASALGLVGFPNVGAYVASKHGVVGLTKTAAAEYANLGVRVNCVCPGHTRTPINERYWADNPEAEAYMLSQEPVGRFGIPSEIAEAVLWLCSDGASFVHGHSLAVDGGMTVV